MASCRIAAAIDKGSISFEIDDDFRQSTCLHHSDRSSTPGITSEGVPGVGDQSFRIAQKLRSLPLTCGQSFLFGCVHAFLSAPWGSGRALIDPNQFVRGILYPPV